MHPNTFVWLNIPTVVRRTIGSVDDQMSPSFVKKPRIDAELAAINVMIPEFDLDDVVASRALEYELAVEAHPRTEGARINDNAVMSRDGRAIPIRVYRPAPRKNSRPLPALLYVHGGAFALGGLHTEEERCALYAARVECAVVALDYRLAPEHPFPAGFNDCVDVLRWIGAQAREAIFDPRRIAVAGNSAGGGLAAALALDARGDSYASLVHQMLINPALDHRSSTESAMHFTNTPVWKRRDNLRMWEMYLQASPAPDFRASPATADDVSGVAPLTIWTAEHDPLRDEGLAYAMRLLSAGVPVGIYQYPGTFHGFDSYRMTPIGRRALEDQVWTLQRAFAI